MNDQQIYECTAAGKRIDIQPDANIGTIFGIAYHKGALYITAPRRALILKLTRIK